MNKKEQLQKQYKEAMQRQDVKLCDYADTKADSATIAERMAEAQKLISDVEINVGKIECALIGPRLSAVGPNEAGEGLVGALGDLCKRLLGIVRDTSTISARLG